MAPADLRQVSAKSIETVIDALLALLSGARECKGAAAQRRAASACALLFDQRHSRACLACADCGAVTRQAAADHKNIVLEDPIETARSSPRNPLINAAQSAVISIGWTICCGLVKTPPVTALSKPIAGSLQTPVADTTWSGRMV
jgi:hypothetical protein